MLIALLLSRGHGREYPKLDLCTLYVKFALQVGSFKLDPSKSRVVSRDEREACLKGRTIGVLYLQKKESEYIFIQVKGYQALVITLLYDKVTTLTHGADDPLRRPQLSKEEKRSLSAFVNEVRRHVSEYESRDVANAPA